MIKILITFYWTFLISHTSLANCPTHKQIWENYQKSIIQKSPQKSLLLLRKICLKCDFQDSTYTQILESIAETYNEQMDYQHAIMYINEAIKLNNTSQLNINNSYLGGNYFKLGNYFNKIGDVQKALKTYDLSILSVKRFPFSWQFICSSYAQKANILTKIGDFEKALEQVNIGINYANEKHNNSGLAECYMEKAKIQITLGGKQDDIKMNLNEAIKVASQKKDKNLGYAYYMYAEYLLGQQKFEESVTFYQKSQKFYDPYKDANYTLAYVSIGMNYYYLKKYEKALENFEKALKTEQNEFVKVNILDNIASTYWMKKEYPKAFINFQKALSAGHIGYTSKSLWDNPSIKALQTADFKQFYLTTLTDKADTWLEYYQTTKQKENLKIALDTYVTADKLIDLMRFEHTGTQSKLYWRNKTHHLYVQAIETCFLLKDYEKAFYFFEKSKAVLLNDQLNGLSANQQLSATDLAQEKGFQQTISELNKKVASEPENSKNYAVLQSQLLEQQGKKEQFVKGLETKNPTYFKYKYDTTLVSLNKVKKYLVKDQTVLEYFMGDDAIYALIISQDKTDLQKIPLLDYSKNAKWFLSYCADNQKINQNFPDFLLVSNQIYQQIFRYLNVPKGRLIITQDGYFLPFEALSKSSKRAEYLLNDYAISYTYSVQFLLKNLGENSFSFSHKFMGMSPVNFSKNLNQTSLSGSDISLSEVASNFVFGKKFSAKEATKNAFLTHAKDYKIVHLYTHAQADSTDQEPMIYFADSVLKLSELNALERFKTQLLVLSACKTAVGKNAKGEGILSLSRGFAALGIPATLTTLWSVENQSTYTLNELFYRYLSEGYPKDISLQKAKIEFLQSQSGEKQLPTFWAAAVLVGDAEAVSFSNGWFYLGIIGMTGLIGFWWYKKLTVRG